MAGSKGRKQRRADRNLQEGLRLHQSGQLREAFESYKSVLEDDPKNADALNLMGVIMQVAGNLEAAITFLEQATQNAPGYFAPYVNLGNALQANGKPAEAVDAFHTALSLNADNNHAIHNNLSSALNDLGEYQSALESAEIALKGMSDKTSARLNLGNALLGLERVEEAEVCFREIVRADPAHSNAWFNLGNALMLSPGKVEDARECFERAVALDEDHAEKHYNLGNTLMKLSLFDEAATSFENTLKLDEAHVGAMCNLGTALQSCGKLAQSIENFRCALLREPESADLHFNMALSLLQNGDYSEGWKEFEWRWQTPQMCAQKRPTDVPTWLGEEFDGKTLLINAEQGFGDAIRFSRFASEVKSRGGNVVMECRSPVSQLLSLVDGIDETFDLGQPLPEHDLQIDLMSLPYALGVTLDNLTAQVPYIHLGDQSSAAFEVNPETKLKIGIVWSGSTTRDQAHLRDCPPELFESLAEVPGVQLYSLQVGAEQSLLDSLSTRAAVIDLTSDLKDFADTAAVVKALDLVISVDTAVLHLAAALGKPVWGLMSDPTGYFWMNERSDSPWYPTVKLFRQPTTGDWNPVFDKVREKLLEQVQG